EKAMATSIPLASSCTPKPTRFRKDDPTRRRLSRVLRSAKHTARHHALRWITLAYKWSKSFRIAYGHTEFERARDYAPCRIGRAFRVLPDQSLVPNERTEARTAGMQAVRAKFGDWVPQMDLEIFLFGFEAGEEFVLRMGSTGYIESFLTSSEASETASGESSVRMVPQSASIPDAQPHPASRSGARS